MRVLIPSSPAESGALPVRVLGLRVGLALALVLAALPSALAQTAPVPAAVDARTAQLPVLERIVATVNDQVISQTDLATRVHLATVASGLPPTQEVQQRLAPQILRGLIDEKLKLQEAARRNVVVTDGEVDQEVADIAARNNIDPATFVQALAARGVPEETLREQVRANLVWAKLVRQRLRPEVVIADEEVQAVRERILANAGKPEYLVSEIFLGVDDAAEESSVRAAAERLVAQLRQGVRFEPVAQQFSEAPGAASGGNLGWVQLGQLPEEVERVVQTLAPGEISDPIRTRTGFTIVQLRDKRLLTASANDVAAARAAARVRLKQLVFAFASEQERAGVRQRLEQVRQEVRGCDAFDQAIAQTGGPESGALAEMAEGELPPPIRAAVASTPVGRASEPVSFGNRMAILMVCARTEPETDLPDEGQIVQTLGTQRLNMLAQRLMRDLRRAAYVEVR